ncbi:hypothetical protein BGZ91_005453, partial [Linnemannia elongata]
LESRTTADADLGIIMDVTVTPAETRPEKTTIPMMSSPVLPTITEITQAVVNTTLDDNKRDQGQGIDQEDLEAAEQGNPTAQNNIGDQYRFGEGVPLNFTTAMEWYRMAADQDDPRGQWSVAQIYGYALGVPMDYSLAMEWYQKAAAKGYAPALCSIGDLYVNGQGVVEDYSMALNWYSKAAEQHYPEAEFAIGLMYQQSLGVLADEATTLKWFGYAIEHADAGGWEDFVEGFINIFGLGVPRDTKIAFEWMLKSAEKGNLYGQSLVGMWYHSGRN